MVTLLTTIHEEDDNAYAIEELQALLDFLTTHYDAIWFGMTDATAPTIRAVIHLYPNHKIHTLELPSYSRDFSRKSILQAAREAIQKASAVQLIDLAELRAWWQTEKETLEEASKTVLTTATFRIYGRSEKALLTFPELLVKAQEVANTLASRYFNRKLDLFGGSLLFSAELMQRLLAGEAKSQLAEWPTLARAAGATLDYVEVDGLVEPKQDQKENALPETLTRQLETTAAVAGALYPATS